MPHTSGVIRVISGRVALGAVDRRRGARCATGRDSRDNFADDRSAHPGRLWPASPTCPTVAVRRNDMVHDTPAEAAFADGPDESSVSGHRLSWPGACVAGGDVHVATGSERVEPGVGLGDGARPMPSLTTCVTSTSSLRSRNWLVNSSRRRQRVRHQVRRPRGADRRHRPADDRQSICQRAGHQLPCRVGLTCLARGSRWSHLRRRRFPVWCGRP